MCVASRSIRGFPLLAREHSDAVTEHFGPAREHFGPANEHLDRVTEHLGLVTEHWGSCRDISTRSRGTVNRRATTGFSGFRASAALVMSKKRDTLIFYPSTNRAARFIQYTAAVGRCSMSGTEPTPCSNQKEGV